MISQSIYYPFSGLLSSYRSIFVSFLVAFFPERVLRPCMYKAMSALHALFSVRAFEVQMVGN